MSIFRGLDQPLRGQVRAAVVKLSQNPNIKSLRLEPLSGVQGVWKIRVNDNFRILIRLVEDEGEPHYLIADLGNHDIYSRRR